MKGVSMENKDSIFINEYKEQIMNGLRLSKPDIDEDELSRQVDVIIDERLESPDAIFSNDYKQKEGKFKLLDLLDNFMKKGDILTGFGVFYKQHDETNNLITSMLDYLLSERNDAKQRMFEAKKDGNEELAKALDRLQGSVLKLLANSYYGASGMPTSQFYNNRVAASVTYTGVQIITHSMLSFERFLSNNIKLNNVSEMLQFMTDVIIDSEFIISEIIREDSFIDEDELLVYLEGMVKDTEGFEEVRNLVSLLNQEQRNVIYYKNQIYKFLDACDMAMNCLSNVVGTEFLDAGDANEEISTNLDLLWDLLEEFVYHDHSIYDRYERAIKDKRESILTVDTDSNFIYMNPFYEFISERFEVEDTKEDTISVVNIGVYFLTHFIEASLKRLTENCNLSEEKQPIINMKNEYLYEKFMSTENKKQYVGRLLSREGVMLDPPITDMKGLSIKKSNVSKRVEEVLTKVIEDEILGSDDISLSRVLKEFKAFEAEVNESLAKGEMTFTTPFKVNPSSNYAFPDRMAQLRGTIIHNELFPNDPIAPPEKINLLKLNAGNPEDLKDLLENGHEEEYKILMKEVFHLDENGIKPFPGEPSFDVSRFGFTTIAFPKNVDNIPEWIRPYIAVNEIVGDNIRHGLIILKSLGFKELKLTDQKTYYSNIIDF